LPGAGCSAAKTWLRAREVLGLTGAPPLGNYDMAAVGLGGLIFLVKVQMILGSHYTLPLR
jgi:hypothetical protein